MIFLKRKIIPHKVDYSLLRDKDNYIFYQYSIDGSIDVDYVLHYNQGRNRYMVNNVIVVRDKEILFVIHNINYMKLHFHYDKFADLITIHHDDELSFADLSDKDKKLALSILKKSKKR